LKLNTLEIDFNDKNNKLPACAGEISSVSAMNGLPWDAKTSLIRASLDVYENLNVGHY